MSGLLGSRSTSLGQHRAVGCLSRSWRTLQECAVIF